LSPNGEKLAVYSVKRKTEDLPRMVELSLIDIDSMDVEILFKSDEYYSIPGLSWSPDGRQIVYSLETSYDHNLYLIDPDFSDKSNLYLLDVETHHSIQITTEDDNLFPDWARNRNLIVYHKYWNRDDDHGDNFFLINPTNGCETEIPYHLPFILGPTWSLDGKKIAFVGPDGIYTLDLVVAFGEDFLRDDFPCE
jgi:Tol biopolymer transport system component